MSDLIERLGVAISHLNTATDVDGFKCRCDPSAGVQCHLCSDLELLRDARAEIERLRKPTYYWDDRDLNSAIDPQEVVDGDDVGDIIELRPIHELPKVWVLVTDRGPEFHSTREAAEAASNENSD